MKPAVEELVTGFVDRKVKPRVDAVLKRLQFVTREVPDVADLLPRDHRVRRDSLTERRRLLWVQVA